MKSIIFISAICCCTTIITAQVADSSKSKVKYPFTETFHEKDFYPGNSLYTPVDTSLDEVQRYFPNNFPYSLGLISRKLIFDPSSEAYLDDGKLGFRSGINSLDIFGFNQSNINYYRTRTPYTELFGLFGMKREQFSRIVHTQNITRQWNIALNMLRIRSEGFYLNQNCTDNNLAVSTNYLSRDNRYSLLANGIVSSIKSDENGGITDDTLFEQNLVENKKPISVNLTDSRSKRLHREIYIKPSLNFGKKENETKGDSIISSNIRPHTTLSFFFNASDNMFAYTEAKLDSGYYENTFFDTIHTHDSTHMEKFQQGLELQSVLFKKIKVNAGLDQRNMRLVQYNADSSVSFRSYLFDQTVKFQIGSIPRKDKSNGFMWNLGKEYITEGNHKDDNLTFGALNLLFNKYKKVSFVYSNAYRSVPFIYNEYSSNHFIWRNSFDKATEVRAKLNYTDSKNRFSIGWELNQITGYVYFDSTFTPKQFDKTLTIYNACIQKKLHLGHFNFNNKITWQSMATPSPQMAKDVIHLPQFVTSHSLYYEGKWFGKVTDVQLGFDFTYYSSYYADAYMPSLGQYYLQNDKMLGNYPFIDFFFNMKIKHARVFFKSEHVNSGLMGANYYLAPHMPAPDRNIKVGVKWMFFD